MMRSSQPHSGPNVKRCREDEKLLNSVLKPGMRGYIIDTRHQSATPTPKVNTTIFQYTHFLKYSNFFPSPRELGDLKPNLITLNGDVFISQSNVYILFSNLFLNLSKVLV